MRIHAFLILAAGLIAVANPRPVCAQSLNFTGSATNNTATTQTNTLSFTDFNLSLPTTRPLTLTTTLSGMFVPVPGSGNTSVLGDSVTIQTFGDANNTPFGTGFPAENFTFTVTNPAITSFSDVNVVTGFNPPGPYSLTALITYKIIAHTELGPVNLTVTAAPAVPEPSSLALLLCGGLSGSAFALRRLRRR